MFKTFDKVRKHDIIYIVEKDKEYQCRVIDAARNPKTGMIFMFVRDYNDHNHQWVFRAAPNDFKWNNFDRFTAYTVAAAIGR